MLRRLVPAGGLVLVLSGCLSEDRSLLVVPESVSAMQRTARHGGTMAAHDPASEATRKRVVEVVEKIYDANPKLGVRPEVVATAMPQPEIFHQWKRPLQACTLFVTEGLVKGCQDEGQLAAVLCLQLGKIVSERTTMSPPHSRAPELPPDIPAGNGSGGQFGPSEGSRMYELARADARREKARRLTLPPDPQVLARQYLTAAGYPATELKAIVPLLRQAEEHSTFEQAINEDVRWRAATLRAAE